MNSNNVIRPNFTRQSNTVLTDGNAVRSLDTPESRREAEELERQQERRRRWEKQIRKRAIQEEYRRRRRSESLFSLREACVVGAVAACFLCSCLFYVMQLAGQTQSAKRLGTLKNEYSELVEDNNAESSRIEGSIDYEAIYEYATDVLGMRHPKKGQSIEYKRSNNSIVNQGEDIPR